MKYLYHYLLLCLVCLSLQSCFFLFQPERRETSEYTPIVMTRAELNQSIKMQAPRSLKQTGKIYVYGTYLFVNERYEGVHIIDNTNPASPQKIGFIAVPGCLDMAVKNSVMYVDNAVDLVAINMASPQTPVITKRVENAFPMGSISPDGYTYQLSSDKIIVGWSKN